MKKSPLEIAFLNLHALHKKVSGYYETTATRMGPFKYEYTHTPTSHAQKIRTPIVQNLPYALAQIQCQKILSGHACLLLQQDLDNLQKAWQFFCTHFQSYPFYAHSYISLVFVKNKDTWDCQFKIDIDALGDTSLHGQNNYYSSTPHLCKMLTDLENSFIALLPLGMGPYEKWAITEKQRVAARSSEEAKVLLSLKKFPENFGKGGEHLLVYKVFDKSETSPH
jgi:hypothetical protein